MWKWLFQSDPQPARQVRFDLHNHLLPAVDDGVRDLEQSHRCISDLIKLGYQGAVLTPHIYPEIFDNTEASLREQFMVFAQQMHQLEPHFQLQLAAEYFVDDGFLRRFDDRRDQLLTMGPQANWLLLEFPQMDTSGLITTTIEECRRLKLVPVLAHVERYLAAQVDTQVRTWRERGALVQVNLGSFSGLYGRDLTRTATHLLREGLVDLLGTDAHGQRHTGPLLCKGWSMARRIGKAFNPERQQQVMRAADGE